VQFDVHPTPTDEEAAALVAAVEALWPKPVVLVQPSGPRTLAWRFSGRWWQRDRMAHADRPWR
jgi:hypothetical protein